MDKLTRHTNEISAELFGDLTSESDRTELSSTMPVMATPAAVAAGAALTAAAFGIGFAAEEAADG